MKFLLEGKGSRPGSAALWARTAEAGRRREADVAWSGLAAPEGRRRATGEGRRVDGDWRMRTPGTGAAAAAEVAGDMLQSSVVVRRPGEVWSSVDSVRRRSSALLRHERTRRFSSR